MKKKYTINLSIVVDESTPYNAALKAASICDSVGYYGTVENFHVGEYYDHNQPGLAAALRPPTNDELEIAAETAKDEPTEDEDEIPF